MQYQMLGHTGLPLSRLSFGSWVTFGPQVDIRLGERLMAMSYERGVNFFDNAEVYSDGESEVIMGKALANLRLSRDSYCLSSKVFWGGPKPTQRGLHRKHLIEAAHAALKRLQVDYLDLYYCHRPDQHTPVEEIVRTMNTLIEQGKILYWGTSEWSAQQITRAYEVAKSLSLYPPSVEQPQYNLFHREKMEHEYLPLFREYAMGTTIWSPLASGILTGKYSGGIPQDSRANLEGHEWLKRSILTPEGQDKIKKTLELQKLARELTMNLSHLAIVWCLRNPHVTSVILGAKSENQLLENLESLDHSAKMTAEVCQRIEEIVKNKPAAEVDYRHH